jgi:hypothetical protein
MLLPQLLAGDGTPVLGIVGKGNQKDCTGLGLLLNRGPQGRPAEAPAK